MSIADFLHAITEHPDQIQFATTMAIIDRHYHFTPTAFRNGHSESQAGQNNGSCKILAFAQMHELTLEDTLVLFGDYYRMDVLRNPLGEDHPNIRNFMRTGWAGVSFEIAPLKAKAS